MIQSVENRRYYELKSLFGYLDSRRTDFSGKGENYELIVYHGDYYRKEPNSSLELIAICSTARAAHYLARIVKHKRELGFLPTIRRTTVSLYPDTAYKIESHLKVLETEFQNLVKRASQKPDNPKRNPVRNEEQA